MQGNRSRWRFSWQWLVRAAGLAAAVTTLAVGADEGVKIRLGTIAPKGSTYHRALQEMGEKWKHAEGAAATFTVFTDGTQGGEADMVRRMRVGQLNAALVSVVGLMEIDRSVTALQYMPMLFRDWSEVDYARDKLHASLEARLLDKGFVVLFWGDAGWARFFSKDAAIRPTDFKKEKMFAWSGDNDQVDLMKTLGYNPVPLETADILPGLQTGLITAVPCAAYYALAGQVDAAAKHMLDLKWVPVVGAAVITKKAWDQLSAAGRDQLKVAADAAGVKIRTRARQEDQEAVDAMKKRGLIVHEPTPEIEAEWRKLAEDAYPKIRGTMVPADTFDLVRGAVAEYRKQNGK
ncbi:MAG: C4-dicarboxylate ABC transporter substrate-binding protein [Proteobacteria bacterium]|nr:MAG: C4-dicarboxylate ABC transporter substrate-binding protein [Pseudomonadota bacterium]